MKRPILFHCPTSGLNVPGYVTLAPPSDGTRHYEALDCLACRAFHFVNVATGKLLSDESYQRPSSASQGRVAGISAHRRVAGSATNVTPSPRQGPVERLNAAAREL
jgi:hypothetical protein